MQKYELVYILKQELPDAEVKKLRDKIEKAIEKLKGTLLENQDLGSKTLAYPIQNQMRGHYFFFSFEGGGALVDELERTLRLSEQTLRFLTVKLEPAEKKEMTEKKETTEAA